MEETNKMLFDQMSTRYDGKYLRYFFFVDISLRCLRWLVLVITLPNHCIVDPSIIPPFIIS